MPVSSPYSSRLVCALRYLPFRYVFARSWPGRGLLVASALLVCMLFAAMANEQPNNNAEAQGYHYPHSDYKKHSGDGYKHGHKGEHDYYPRGEKEYPWWPDHHYPSQCPPTPPPPPPCPPPAPPAPPPPPPAAPKCSCPAGENCALCPVGWIASGNESALAVGCAKCPAGSTTSRAGATSCDGEAAWMASMQRV